MAIYSGMDVGTVICEALGLEANTVKQIIIDIDSDAPIRVYVEMYATDWILDLDWAKGLKGAEVTVLDKAEERRD